MNVGVLNLAGVRYSLTEDGWSGGELAADLDRAFPVRDHDWLGDPVCAAFDRACRVLGPNSVVSRPAPPPPRSRRPSGSRTGRSPGSAS